jgi:hypothetical protein
MSKLAAIVSGLALASVVVAAVSVRQGPRAGGEARPVPAARLEVPVPPKADRLPLPAIAAPEPLAPAVEPLPFLRAQLEPPAPKPHSDPVCGPRGRVWYTKDNGYRYWKCIR